MTMTDEQIEALARARLDAFMRRVSPQTGGVSDELWAQEREDVIADMRQALAPLIEAIDRIRATAAIAKVEMGEPA